MTGFAICLSGEWQALNEVQDATIKDFGCMTNSAAVIKDECAKKSKMIQKNSYSRSFS